MRPFPPDPKPTPPNPLAAEVARLRAENVRLQDRLDQTELVIDVQKKCAATWDRTANAVTQVLIDLGVIKSHSRPSVSDDNPYLSQAVKVIVLIPPDRRGHTRCDNHACPTEDR